MAGGLDDSIERQRVANSDGRLLPSLSAPSGQMHTGSALYTWQTQPTLEFLFISRS